MAVSQFCIILAANPVNSSSAATDTIRRDTSPVAQRTRVPCGLRIADGGLNRCDCCGPFDPPFAIRNGPPEEEENMKTLRRWHGPFLVGSGLLLAALTGCQTYSYSTGMTLPSGHYLQHPPQYIPPSPAFPLQRELARQEAVAAQAGLPVGPGAPALAPPVPVVPAPAPAAAPAPPPAPLPPPGM